MEEQSPKIPSATEPDRVDVSSLVQRALEEFVRAEDERKEPGYKLELQEERKRREGLERRLNELVEENNRSRQLAEMADRNASIRTELQRLGVAKIDLAFRAVKDDIARTEDGRLVGRTEAGDIGLKDYLAGFVNANPEFLPARISGGSGIPSSLRSVSGFPTIDIDNIRPGMTPEEREHARQAIARIASQTLRGT